MIDGWALWLVLVGLAVGVLMTWLFVVRLPRDESDVSADERRDEAAWISGTIGRRGGVAPGPLVEEVLDLHQVYLRRPDLARPPRDATMAEGTPLTGGRYPPPPMMQQPMPPQPMPPQPPRPPGTDGTISRR